MNSPTQLNTSFLDRLQQITGVPVAPEELAKLEGKIGTIHNSAEIMPGMKGHSGCFRYLGHDVTISITTINGQHLSAQRIDYSGEQSPIEVVNDTIAGLIRLYENPHSGGRGRNADNHVERTDYGL